MQEEVKTSRHKKIVWIVMVAIFAALSSILYYFPKFSLPFLFPSFLKIQFSNLPIIMIGFLLGPLAGITTLTIKTLIALNKTNQKRCDEFVRKIEDAACAYTSMSKVVCNRNACNTISLSTLISEGFIEEEIDVCTGNSINENQTVTISWPNNEKTCTYNGGRTYER